MKSGLVLQPFGHIGPFGHEILLGRKTGGMVKTSLRGAEAISRMIHSVWSRSFSNNTEFSSNSRAWFRWSRTSSEYIIWSEWITPEWLDELISYENDTI